MAITQQSPTGPQLMFLAFLTSDITNATGDGTNATYVFDTAEVNVGSCYNTSTGVFTVPTTGVYMFQCGLALLYLTSANQVVALSMKNSTNNTYATILQASDWSLIGQGRVVIASPFCFNPANLTVGDNIYCFGMADGSTKTVALHGESTVNYSWWACYKVT